MVPLVVCEGWGSLAAVTISQAFDVFVSGLSQGQQ